MHLPSLKFLKTIQVAAKLQSFKTAAEELFVTPSASQQPNEGSG
jgi:hypothetical protein